MPLNTMKLSTTGIMGRGADAVAGGLFAGGVRTSGTLGACVDALGCGASDADAESRLAIGGAGRVAGFIEAVAAGSGALCTFG